MHPVFTALEAEELLPQNFDAALQSAANRIVCVFFWGHDCPNCEVAKALLHQDLTEVKSLGFQWYQVNVYEQPELGTRFGLHGIPAFYFFRDGKKLGKISPFPGMEPFMRALRGISG